MADRHRRPGPQRAADKPLRKVGLPWTSPATRSPWALAAEWTHA